MSDADMMQLYSKRILALAADIPHLGKLENADGSAMKRSPQCGSTVTAHVRMDGDRIADFGQEVRACALGQASAGVLGQAVIGATRADLARGAQQVRLAGTLRPPQVRGHRRTGAAFGPQTHMLQRLGVAPGQKVGQRGLGHQTDLERELLHRSADTDKK